MLLMIEIEGEDRPARRGAAAIERVALGEGAVGADSAGASRADLRARTVGAAKPGDIGAGAFRPADADRIFLGAQRVRGRGRGDLLGLGHRIERRFLAEHLIRGGGARAELLGGAGCGREQAVAARIGRMRIDRR